ncbi:MAG: N-acetylmuramoyl-L-alanine amidase [Rikenellaceae bacterium]|jgi:N-acetylmuramoyl-L-alanine amidase|nr:N-acetylmuramoyl-L-alanine amidase [Rikenellaceae bacterium]
MNRRLLTLLIGLCCLPAFFSSQAPAQTVGSGYQMKKIVLDPGHGGRLPGAVAGGIREKDVVLAVALRVGQLLNENLPDVEVIYTRKTDVNVELQERGDIANRNKADLFISIHADAAESRSATGSSTWVMGLSREQSNLQLAMRENSVITYEEDYQTKYEGFDPADPASYIMFSLMQSTHIDQSVEFAALCQKYYKQHTTIPTSRGVRQSGFLVLHRTTMPSVLTEIGFLTNASDRAFMTTQEGQEKIARSIFNAISEYKSTVEGSAQIITLDAAEGSRQSTTAAQTTAAPASSNRPAAPQDNSGTIFKVQVSASRTPVDRKRFGRYADRVAEQRIDGYYKYFVGAVDSYAEALSLQREVRGTFRDAFVVAFENDRPVTLTDEMKHGNL